MHIIVVGCGRVGTELATSLSADGHTVAVIDKNPRAFARLGEFEGDTITGLGFDRDALIAAGIERAGALGAVTSGDNSNILIARVARENCGLDRVVARIQDPARAEIYERLGISTVASVTWATDQIKRRLLPGAADHAWLDPSGSVQLVELELPDAWAGRKLSEISEPGRWTIAAVTRLGAAIVPAPDTVGQAKDVLHIMVTVEATPDLDRRLVGDDQGAGHS